MDSKRRSQSFDAPPLEGMTKTSTSVFHETDRGSCRTKSTCVFQLTVREGFCRGVSSHMLWGVVEKCKGRGRAVSYAARGLEDVRARTPAFGDTDLCHRPP